MNDNITGYFVRAKRDGKWQSLDIATLSEKELGEVFKDATKERVLMFVVALTAWIRENTIPSEIHTQTSGGRTLESLVDKAPNR